MVWVVFALPAEICNLGSGLIETDYMSTQGQKHFVQYMYYIFLHYYYYNYYSCIKIIWNFDHL